MALGHLIARDAFMVVSPNASVAIKQSADDCLKKAIKNYFEDPQSDFICAEGKEKFLKEFPEFAAGRTHQIKVWLTYDVTLEESDEDPNPWCLADEILKQGISMNPKGSLNRWQYVGRYLETNAMKVDPRGNGRQDATATLTGYGYEVPEEFPTRDKTSSGRMR